MNVAVDQTGQDEGVAQIHNSALRSVADEAVTHFYDLVPSDHESFTTLHNAVGRIRQQTPCLNEHCRL
ncbi:hypothetical protein GCM10009081_15590 [Brevundimonas nasdae]